MVLQRVRVPLGVIGIIYESRPNVTADAAALCLRSGNAVILRGGSEAMESNRAIHSAMVGGIKSAGLAADAVRSEEHTSELQSLMRISYAVFCLKKKKNNTNPQHIININTYNMI